MLQANDHMKKNNQSIAIIAGARPNFMKVAPLIYELEKQDMDHFLVNTGQHWSKFMAYNFLKEFNIKPKHTLKPAKPTVAKQMSDIKKGLEDIFTKEQPSIVVVVGDVNSTLAGAQVAHKMKIPLAHIEAGLRSFNLKMPEEHNRIKTDKISDLLFVTQQEGVKNLKNEHVRGQIHFVGNIMIDTLEALRHSIEDKRLYLKYSLGKGDYGLVTIHRPSNVDSASALGKLCKNLICVSMKIPLIMIIHPRTLKNLNKYSLMHDLKHAKNLYLLDPLNYTSFMNLVFNCRLVITDSGGLQEETTYLGIPCLTIRENTERPITVQHGTNMLCKPEEIPNKVDTILSGWNTKRKVPEKWDGHTAHRVVQSIKKSIPGIC